MTLHICILGIDGSGKSTVCRVLPRLLAAEHNCRAGSCGDGFTVVAPDEDITVPGFEPQSPLAAVRLARFFKRKAKRHVDNRKWYAVLKLAHLILQDSAAFKLSRRHHVDVMISDGDLMLSAAGRAANYRRPASDDRQDALPEPQPHDLATAYAYILEGRPLPPESRRVLPSLRLGRWVYRWCRIHTIKAGLLPDVVVLLDISPATALQRIARRGGRTDRHENLSDLEQAGHMYLRTLDAFREFRPDAQIIVVPCDHFTAGQTLQAVMDATRPIITARGVGSGTAGRPLGTTTERLVGSSFIRKIFNFRYLFGYLARYWFRSAWREPLFVCSPPGRRFLREGYSADVMKDIYELTNVGAGFFQRAFLNYPLHRAVYDRLQILVEHLSDHLRHRLAQHTGITVFSAPSGYAYDVLGAVSRVSPDQRAGRALRFVASDLDPHDRIQSEVRRRARELGVELEFLRADLTEASTRRKYEEYAPFDAALFVGLSSWLPKPHTIEHLRWLSSVLKPDGLLLTDCFTPAPYALSGKYVGYKAHYYEPDVFAAILDVCGFDAATTRIHSGRDSTNHVLIASPKPGAGKS